jgi:hypothetical protein
MTNLALPSVPSFDDKVEILGRQITLLAGQINAANHRLLKLIAEFDRRKGWCSDGTVRSCAHWLNWKCGIALVAAREKVRVARCLEELPLIDAAFAAGEISYSKVRAMTRVATPENEEYLLYIAHYGTASHVEQVVRKYRKVKQADDTIAEGEQERKKDLVYYQDSDGMWIIHAKLPAEAGSLVVKAIEAVATPEQEKKQAEIPEKDSAESFSEEVEQQEPVLFRELLSHTRADALVSISEHLKHWADGGETSLDNLVTLCRYHHRQLHQGGFNITVEKSDEEQQLVFSTPSGRKIESSFFPQFQNDSAESFSDTVNTMAPDVDPTTSITRWTGEDCDYGMVIDGLLERDGCRHR